MLGLGATVYCKYGIRLFYKSVTEAPLTCVCLAVYISVVNPNQYLRTT
jgi:hypothetical protein